MFKGIKDLSIYPQPYRVKLLHWLRRIHNDRTLAPYIYRMLFGNDPKPCYGYCLYRAAVLAKSLGYDALSVIEFGVANGDGLLRIEKHIRELRKTIDIKFHVFGFDLETGVPITEDHRDIAFKGWLGKYKMENKSGLESCLEFSSLIIGDVTETVPTFPDYQPKGAPVGCIFFDLDLYSSTMSAFQIFDQLAEDRLPRVISYFDDILGTNEFIGELAAIGDFNRAHADMKIVKPYGLSAIRPYWWIELIFQMHDFDHPDYGTEVEVKDADIY